MKEGGVLSRLGWGGRAAELTAVDRLERRLGVRFRRRALLELALTHSSYSNERGLETSYERLEFLGDSVLGLLASQWLYEEYPELAEGRLTELRSLLVGRGSLAAQAERLGVGEALRLGVGEERSGGRRKVSLLADALEAILGAIFLDRGLEAARGVAVELFQEAMAAGEEQELGDAKGRLQGLAQAEGMELPIYRLVGETGPPHRKRFTVECRLAERLVSTGEGRTKKIAEQRAAAELVGQLAARS